MGAAKDQANLLVCEDMTEHSLLTLMSMYWLIYLQETSPYLSLPVKDTMNCELILKTGRGILGLPSIESSILDIQQSFTI